MTGVTGTAKMMSYADIAAAEERQEAMARTRPRVNSIRGVEQGASIFDGPGDRNRRDRDSTRGLKDFCSSNQGRKTLDMVVDTIERLADAYSIIANSLPNPLSSRDEIRMIFAEYFRAAC